MQFEALKIRFWSHFFCFCRTKAQLRDFRLNYAFISNLVFKDDIAVNFNIKFYFIFSSSSCSYNKYTVFHDGEDAFNYMVELQTESTELDFWLLTRNMSIVTVSPKEQNAFESRLTELNAQYVAKPLMEEMSAYNETLPTCDGAECTLKRTRRQARGFFSHFPRYSEVCRKEKKL